MEAEGFLILLEDDKVAGERLSCQRGGGRPGQGGVVHTRVEGIRNDNVQTILTYRYEDARPEARDAVQKLAATLTAEIGKAHIESHRLMSYYWWNDLSGERVQLPGNWEFASRVFRADGVQFFNFTRRESDGRPTTRVDEVTVIYIPLFRLKADDQMRLIVEGALLQQPQATVVARRGVDGKETVSDIQAQDGLHHIWRRRGTLNMWAATWLSPDEQVPIKDPQQHELLSQLLKTLH